MKDSELIEYLRFEIKAELRHYYSQFGSPTLMGTIKAIDKVLDSEIKYKSENAGKAA